MPPISARHLLNKFRFILRLFVCGYNFPSAREIARPRCGPRSRIDPECSAAASIRQRIAKTEMTATRGTLVSLKGV
ncbi:MAG: hypothetical protein DMF04_09710 [Verrucomicrobia bacterium]|nr:MAG: hypothetical protein DMF04_09710 [Verrucomicrobiota bacterium]